MARHPVLRQIEPLTHDTWRLVLDRPEGFDFTPGQAVDLALDRDGWRDETRPFTLTSQPEDPSLEFVIKSYPAHDGVTARVATLQPGERVLMGEPWGAIRDVGPGTFIAGGAGVTPFIPILRRRARAGTLAGCQLVFANRCPADIILRQEWEGMADLQTTFPVDAPEGDLPAGPIDGDLLERVVPDFGGTFYLCGPPAMERAARAALREHGVSDAQIVTEDMPAEETRAQLFAA